MLLALTSFVREKQQPVNDDQKNELADIKFLIKSNQQTIKPYFGLMFWQLHHAESVLTPEEFAQHGMSMNLEDETDEVLAAFTAAYVKIWLSANDFHAASRYIASELNMTADELIQSRQFWMTHR
jgi:hypothetical protein